MQEVNENTQSQKKLIREWLEAGNSITPMEALNLFGCFRLGARIWDLRDEGMKIETEMNYNGRKKNAVYYLKK